MPRFIINTSSSLKIPTTKLFTVLNSYLREYLTLLLKLFNFHILTFMLKYQLLGDSFPKTIPWLFLYAGLPVWPSWVLLILGSPVVTGCNDSICQGILLFNTRHSDQILVKEFLFSCPACMASREHLFGHGVKEHDGLDDPSHWSSRFLLRLLRQNRDSNLPGTKLPHQTERDGTH